MVASNDTLIVELVLGYCDRSWFQPLSDYSRLTKRRKTNYEDNDFTEYSSDGQTGNDCYSNQDTDYSSDEDFIDGDY